MNDPFNVHTHGYFSPKRTVTEEYHDKIVADAQRQLVAKDREIEHLHARVDELIAKINEGQGPIISWLTDEMNRARMLDREIKYLQADYNEAREEVTTYSILLDEAQAENERLTALTEADGKEIGSYSEGTGLRGENRDLQVVIDRLQADNRTLLATTVHAERYTKKCIDYEKLQARVEALEGAIEFAFNNASNSFMGVNFSFEAVKKLRESTEQESSDE
jgi:hypothetical protein